jgi:ATP-dependent Clp protease protease subunit
MNDRRCELAAPESREKEREASMLSERLLESRTILLAEPITKEVAERLTAKLLLLDQESDKELINIYINSPGGDVDAGFAIFDVVRYISAPVRCISTGLTASAAVVVLLATPKKLRLSLPNSRFLMHQPSMGIHGSAADVRIEANEILKMREKINKLIAEETGQPLDKVEKGTRRNYWMDAEEAKKYGLVSRIIKSKSEIAE